MRRLRLQRSGRQLRGGDGEGRTQGARLAVEPSARDPRGPLTCATKPTAQAARSRRHLLVAPAPRTHVFACAAAEVLELLRAGTEPLKSCRRVGADVGTGLGHWTTGQTDRGASSCRPSSLYPNQLLCRGETADACVTKNCSPAAAARPSRASGTYANVASRSSTHKMRDVQRVAFEHVGVEMFHGFMAGADNTPMVGFVAASNSLCDELRLSAEHCARTGQILVVSDDDALTQAAELLRRMPTLRVRADVGAWRHTYATTAEPLDDVDNLFGIAGWYEQHHPTTGRIAGYTPSRFLRAEDRGALQALLEQTDDLPGNIVTRIAVEAAILEARYREDFLEDLAPCRGRRFSFVFADREDPVATYQRLDGLRRVLAEHPGSELDHVDPLVAADAIAHGASRAFVGASSGRRMPRRPGDSGGGPISAGYLPGLFLEELQELRSPTVYADWYANSRSPYCATCRRALDVFAPTKQDKTVIIRHNLHQTTEHINRLAAVPPADRAAWLRGVRLNAHAQHMKLNPLATVLLNRGLREFLMLDDTAHRSMTRSGAWT